MKIKIINKAWRVNAEKFYEHWHHDTGIYYGTRGQAKRQALPDNDAGELIKTGTYPDFLTMPVIRAKDYDIILYKGEKIKRYQIREVERKIKIKNLPKDKCFYVQDARNYVGNAVLWWGINGRGYVTDLSKAHKYTWQEIQDFNPRDLDIIWESEHVEKAIRQYVDMQGLNRDNSF